MKKNGFTLIETMVVMCILLILIGLGLFMSMDTYRNFISHADEDTFISVLYAARSRSLNNINQHEHGVRLEAGSLVLFQGDGPNLTYATRDASLDEPLPINGSMVVSWPSPSEVVFDQLSGNIDNSFLTGNITVASASRSITVSFNNQGGIEW